MTALSFKDLEHAGWSAKADAYDSFFGKITDQAIESVLDALGNLQGKRLLDVACGTGRLTGAAAAQGAEAEGIDFAATMIATAAGNYPDCAFTEGDAQRLPFEDGCFDAAACAFGLLHMENADQAMAETLRVLKPGGRYAFTAWHGPDRGGEMFALVMRAVEQHGSLDVGLPPAPPMFRLADPEEARRALLAVGFAEITSRVLPLQWRPASAEAALEMLYKSVVRMPMILEAQTDAAREQIHAAILEGVNSLRREDGIAVAYPALLVSATRPG